MKMLIFEFRKTILRRYMIVAISIAVVVNFVFATIQYNKCGVGFSDEITEKVVSESQWDDFEKLHNRLDGKITKEKVEYISKLEDGNSGEFDSSIVHTYFYEPIRYRISYEFDNENIVDSARGNIDFYHEINNQFEVNKNNYIVNHYSGRKLRYFYDTQGWKKLFEYDFSGLLILILLLIAILPLYNIEKKNGMNDLILTTKKWAAGYLGQKKLVVLLFVFALNIIFSVINYLIFNGLYGLKYASERVYAIAQYRYTPLNVSLISYYLIICFLQAFSIWIMLEYLLLLGRRIDNIYILYMISILLIIIAMYLGGYVNSENPMFKLISILSPLSGLMANNALVNCNGIRFFDKFVFWPIVFIVVQIIVAVLIHFLEYFIITRRRKSINA